MIYRQPRLHSDKTGVSVGKILDLFYKPYGRVYGRPVLSAEDLKRDVSEFLARIYYLDSSGLERAMAKMGWPQEISETVFDGSDDSTPGQP